MCSPYFDKFSIYRFVISQVKVTLYYLGRHYPIDRSSGDILTAKNYAFENRCYQNISQCTQNYSN
jgi:hypothetical protein